MLPHGTNSRIIPHQLQFPDNLLAPGAHSMYIASRLTTLNLSLLLASVTSLPGAAFAQQTDAAANTVPSAAASAAANKQQATQEVVVTASRRPERLQDVPLAVTAISADQLSNAGIHSVSDLGSVVSGISFGVSPATSGLRIRGAGQMGGFSSAAETPVGVVVDNVVYGLSPMVDNLADVERVEILKGPQGTQFGKNASSGAISITTARPTMDRLKADAFASIGNDSERELRGVFNLPLGETAAARITLYQRSFDGMAHNATRSETWGGQKRKGMRGKLLYASSKQFDALLIVDAATTELTGPSTLFALRTPPPALISKYPVNGGPKGNVFPAGATFGPDNTTIYEDAPGNLTHKRGGVSLELNYYAGGYTFTSISAHRTDKLETYFAIDGTPIDSFNVNSYGDKSQTTQELRVTSPKGRLEYVAGYYFYKQPTELGQFGYVRPALPFAPIYAPVSRGISQFISESVSHAVFADGKVRLTSDGKTRALFGVRINRDQVTASNTSMRDPALDKLPVVPYQPIPYMQGQTFKVGNSGRLGLEHRVHKDLMLYGTVATGFLGPTVAYSATTSTRTDVAPQKVRDLTLGFKSQFRNRWITFNGAFFNDQYSDLQTALFRNGEFVTENAGAARSRGVELDLSARINAELRVRGSATYADAVFTDYLTACPAGGATSRCTGPLVNGAPRDFQAAGEAIPGAAKVSTVAGVDYVTETDDERIIDASATYAYRSKISYQVGVPAAAQDGYGTLNLAAHYGAADFRWRVGAYVRNATDKRFHAAVLPLPLAQPGGVANWPTYEGAGRHVGVTLELRY